MGKISVIWSTSYDNIMSCASSFDDIFSWDKLKNTKKVYSIDTLKKESWWSGLNIAYNLALLWEKPILLTSIWEDFSFSDFMKENVDLSKVYKSEDKLTSRSYIMTDSDDTKFRSYFLWATWDGKNIDLEVLSDTSYAVVSKFQIDTMIEALKVYKKAWVKTIFSPWFQIENMTKQNLDSCFEYADILVVNQDWYENIKKRAEKTDEKMIALFDYIIITYGINWSKIFDNNYHMHEIPWVQNHEFIDAVWVGDSYKAWLVKGLNSGLDIKTSAKLWAIVASISTWSVWAHSHTITWDILQKLYKDTYGEEIKK